MHAQGHLSRFSEEVQDLGTKVLQAALALHEKVASTFRKTAVNFHYEFTVRHLANVFQARVIVWAGFAVFRMQAGWGDKTGGSSLLSQNGKLPNFPSPVNTMSWSFQARLGYILRYSLLTKLLRTCPGLADERSRHGQHTSQMGQAVAARERACICRSAGVGAGMQRVVRTGWEGASSW